MHYLDRTPALLEKADHILNCFLRLPREITGDKTGGYLTLRNAHDAQVAFCHSFGRIPQEKHHKYLMLSLEKGARLWQFHASRGDLLSWQSRDPSSFVGRFQVVGEDPWGLWGGAIHAGEYILSFSGLPEEGDEALVLALAVLAAFIPLGQAQDMAKISNNQVFGPLYDLIAA